MAAVDEPIHATRCARDSGGCLAGPFPGGMGERCQTHDLWFELGRQIELFLRGITLADVITGCVAGRAIEVPPIAVPTVEPEKLAAE